MAVAALLLFWAPVRAAGPTFIPDTTFLGRHPGPAGCGPHETGYNGALERRGGRESRLDLGEGPGGCRVCPEAPAG